MCTYLCLNEKPTEAEYKLVPVDYLPTESVKDEDITKFIRDATPNPVIIVGTKMKMEQDHQLVVTWAKKVIGGKMLDKTRELGLQSHGSPPQTMKDLGQCWARDGSMKNAQMVWIVLYGILLGIHP